MLSPQMYWLVVLVISAVPGKVSPIGSGCNLFVDPAAVAAMPALKTDALGPAKMAVGSDRQQAGAAEQIDGVLRLMLFQTLSDTGVDELLPQLGRDGLKRHVEDRGIGATAVLRMGVSSSIRPNVARQVVKVRA